MQPEVDTAFDDIDPDEFAGTFGNQLWRLENLYKIQTKDGPVDFFTMSKMQQRMYHDRWYRNAILKVRQIGSSTLWCIVILDSCLFGVEPLRAGIIAQTRPDAAALLAKCRFAFDLMDQDVKDCFGLELTKKREDHLIFSNGSFIRSGISMRSGTIDFLLVSELGKLAAKFPSKAKEVITGSIPAIPADGMIVVESTAEGHDGFFFDMVETAGEIQDNPSRVLGAEDFNLHFFPWYDQQEYRSDNVFELNETHDLYFEKLRMRSIEVDINQKWWWARNKELFRDAMCQEFPSYREEAFQVGGKGLYLAKAMVDLEEKGGHIGDMHFDPTLPCVTAWDLGTNTAIWIYQYWSPTHRVYLHYLEGEGGDFEFWKGELDKLTEKFGYHYAAHIFPWDGESRKDGHKTMKIFAEMAGLENIEVIEMQSHKDQVRLGKMMMGSSFFDLMGTLKGRKRIMGYRRRFDNQVADFVDEVVKNLASHGAEAWLLSLFYDPSGLAMPARDNAAGKPITTESKKVSNLWSKFKRKKPESEPERQTTEEKPRSVWGKLFGR